MKKIILSDQKLNQLVDDVTATLMQEFAFEQNAISGVEISRFCAHAQVNQFILFRIYQDWNAHIGQMVHPYFDFGANEVKEGLRRFLNILSGHIKISESDFQPLVRQAVYNSLRLLLNPEEAIGKFFFLNTESVNIEVYRKHAPYYSNFDFVIQAILKYHEKNALQQIEKGVFFEKFERVIELWEKSEGRSINEYQREAFKSLTGRELEDVIASNVAKEAPKAEVTASAQEKEAEKPAQESQDRSKPVIKIRPNSSPGTEQPEKNKAEEVVEQVKEKTTLPPWVETPPATDSFDEKPKEEPKFSTTAKPPQSNTPPWVKDQAEIDADKAKREAQNLASEKAGEKEEKTLSEQFEDNRPKSLNEMFASRDQKSLVEQQQDEKEHQERPRFQVNIPSKEQEKKEDKPSNEMPRVQKPLVGPEDDANERVPEMRTIADQFRNSEPEEDEGASKAIKAEQIPVHKQFQFVQKVFGGSSVKFKVVLDKINKTENLEDAVEVLDKYVFNDPNVNRNDKVSKEFEAMVRGRFNG